VGTLQPLRVAVVPARELRARSRLLAALEAAEPVRFERAGSWDGLDAVIAFGPDGEDALRDAPAGLPSLLAVGDEPAPGGARAVVLSESLERPLRGARLSDARAVTLDAGVAGDVVASVDGAPAWVVSAGHHVVACAPAELEPEEALRERLAPGRCLALLALVHFLRSLAGDLRWSPPPLRAAFVVDDPNLHWPSYGHLRYRELLAHAREHRYHLAVAMVPLDGWLAHRGTARLFRDGAAQLSVCVHGNDHDGPELGRPRDDAHAIALAAQALTRMAAFERRTGVAVSRVMVPPHERVSEPAARALLTCGYEAICTTRPYPWVTTRQDLPWLMRPADAGPLAAWGSVDVVAGGLPLLLRSSLEHSREDLVLRAFLGQPLILYGHHDAFAGGLDVLAQAAADINRLGDVHWQSLAAIVRAGAETRRAGSSLEVRLLSRRARLDVPGGARELSVDLAALAPEGARLRLYNGGPPTEITAGAPAVLHGDGPRRVELELIAASDDDAIGSRRMRLRPLARRLASEARDRGRALLP
jgi:hypothetical protein